MPDTPDHELRKRIGITNQQLSSTLARLESQNEELSTTVSRMESRLRKKKANTGPNPTYPSQNQPRIPPMPEDCDRIAQLEARVLRLEHALNRLSGANECNREDLWDNIWSSFIFPSPDSGKAGDW